MPLISLILLQYRLTWKPDWEQDAYWPSWGPQSPIHQSSRSSTWWGAPRWPPRQRPRRRISPPPPWKPHRLALKEPMRKIDSKFSRIKIDLNTGLGKTWDYSRNKNMQKHSHLLPMITVWLPSSLGNYQVVPYPYHEGNLHMIFILTQLMAQW